MTHGIEIVKDKEVALEIKLPSFEKYSASITKFIKDTEITFEGVEKPDLKIINPLHESLILPEKMQTP